MRKRGEEDLDSKYIIWYGICNYEESTSEHGKMLYCLTVTLSRIMCEESMIIYAIMPEV